MPGVWLDVIVVSEVELKLKVNNYNLCLTMAGIIMAARVQAIIEKRGESLMVA